jgi:REP element-mobilizing transposase RayT
MPQSFCQLYVHVVFSTKGRERWLDDSIRQRVHGYLAATLRNLSCKDIHVGGTDDHVHLLFLLAKHIAPAELVHDLKNGSSKAIKKMGESYGAFYWQKGYALFSVSPTARDAVVKYVDGQEKHHMRVSFQDEVVQLLEMAGVEYDKRYLFE